jgi:SAM-dependent methyltransferase
MPTEHIDKRTLGNPIPPLKLNLGCRNILLPGYINIDMMCLDLVDHPSFTLKDKQSYYQMDVMEIDEHFLAGTVDEVYASHFFEHLSDNQVTNLVWKIWTLLKPGGKLTIITPDFHAILNHFKAKHEQGDFSDVDLLHIRVFDIPEQSGHRTIWYKEIGKYYLEREGYYFINTISAPSIFEVQFEATKLPLEFN